jgi:hypothetical protein
MTADEFERGYAARSQLTLEVLRQFRTVRPCTCGQDGCEGWQSLSHDRAAEYDRAAADRDRVPVTEGLAVDLSAGRRWPEVHEDLTENVEQAIARLVYEQTTGRDWNLAARDPGRDPVWRARAGRLRRPRDPTDDDYH